MIEEPPFGQGDDDDADGVSEEDVAWEDAFIARNRDALNEMLREAEREYAANGPSKRTIADIIADGLRRHGQ